MVWCCSRLTISDICILLFVRLLVLLIVYDDVNLLLFVVIVVELRYGQQLKLILIIYVGSGVDTIYECCTQFISIGEK